jgi:hypothetical protein
MKRCKGTRFPGTARKVCDKRLGGDRLAPYSGREESAPAQFVGQPVTNIRNVKSPHWRRWLEKSSLCAVRTSFCEYADTKPRKTPTWFALSEGRPLFGFAGIGRPGTAREVRRARPSRAFTNSSASSRSPQSAGPAAQMGNNAHVQSRVGRPKQPVNVNGTNYKL